MKTHWYCWSGHRSRLNAAERAWHDLLVERHLTGLPSETLLRRPDILQSEHMLKGRTQHRRCPRSLFPRITLVANGGYASVKLTDLFKPSLLPGILCPDQHAYF